MLLLKTDRLLLSLLLASFGASLRISIFKPGENTTVIKIFGQPQVSVSKFPPIVEFLVHRIQSHFSTYVHEDLSRPPAWDKPVYTLSPVDQQFFNLTSTSATPEDVESIDSTLSKPESTTDQGLEFEDFGNTTEVVESPDDFEYEELGEITDKLFEVITETNEIDKNNKTYVYITPRPPTHRPLSDKYGQTTEKVIDPDLELDITLAATKSPVGLKLFNRFIKRIRPEELSTVTSNEY